MKLHNILLKRIAILDGAMGTMLQEKEMAPGECPELFGVNNPGLLEDIHYQYMEAGADIIQTNTFGGNRFKLAEYGLQERAAEINAEAVRIARAGTRGKALVAASIGPSGKMLQPFGDTSFAELYAVFGEQMQSCEKAGADLLSIETMTDIGEMRAALIAAHSYTRLPVIAHMTFEPGGRTLMGTDPLTALVILEALQPLAIGANCSGGARELLPIIEEMGRYSNIFLSVEPNAGLPQLVEGRTIFPDSPEEMAEYALKLRDAGANIIGGCCGTTPEHIKAIAGTLRRLSPQKRSIPGIRALAARSQTVILGEGKPLAFIGERINPTARKKLAQDIKEGRMQMVVEEARKQVEADAPILDVNMGVPGIDEAAAMREAVIAIQAAVDVPLALDSADPSAIEEGLQAFVGRPLINSTTGEDKQLEIVLPLARKYGAAVLGLCLDENGIPGQAEDRVKIARKIYEKAREYGLREEDIYIDCLVKTASAEQPQVYETLRALRAVKEEMHVGTVLGVSNVSHGLPARELLNSSYLAMAWAAGLDLPIMNPFESRMMDATRAAAVLLNRDLNSIAFIDKYKDYKTDKSQEAGISSRFIHPVCRQCNIPELLGGGTRFTTTDSIERSAEGKVRKQEEEKGQLVPETASLLEAISQGVLQGNKELLLEKVQIALGPEGIAPIEIVNKGLIPGIEEAGELYEQKRYFLPQLMLAAESMKEAFSLVKSRMDTAIEENKGTIVLATVEGDIHDIGKNIVAILLENYGFKILDMGKDVKAEAILELAEREKADIIGLSALMTTTMPRMQEVISGVKARGMPCKIMVGGAVLNQEYADHIGADAYSEDARQAVLTAQRLTGGR